MLGLRVYRVGVCLRCQVWPLIWVLRPFRGGFQRALRVRIGYIIGIYGSPEYGLTLGAYGFNLSLWGLLV